MSPSSSKDCSDFTKREYKLKQVVPMEHWVVHKWFGCYEIEISPLLSVNGKGNECQGNGKMEIP